MNLKEGYVISGMEFKKMVLTSASGLKKYKFLDYPGLYSLIFGSVDKKALFLLMDTYGLTQSVAMEYMKYIPFAEEESYNEQKLDSLVSARHLLEKNGMFHKDSLFLSRIRRYPVTFVGNSSDPLAKKCQEYLKQYTEVLSFEEPGSSYDTKVYEYGNTDLECYGICSEILRLHESGVPYSRIHLLNMTDSHAFLFRRMAECYGIPFEKKKDSNILHTPFAKSVLSLMEKSDSFQEVLDQCPESVFKKPFISLITEYEITEENPKNLVSFVRDAFRHMAYPSDAYSEAVSISMMDYIPDTDYAFLMGITEESFPKTCRDDGYLADALLSRLHLPTSVMRNKEEMDKAVYLLTKVKNMHASYSLASTDGALTPSSLISSLGLKVMEGIVPFGDSRITDGIRLARAVSLYEKTKETDPVLNSYSMKDIPYKTFDPAFKGIPSDFMKERFTTDKPLKLSYTAIKTYFECPFHFYLDRILGLNTFESTTATRLGTYCHAVLEDSYLPDFDFDQSVKKHKIEGLSELDPADFSKDEFYFHQMEAILSALIAFNREREGRSRLNEVRREQNIEVKKDNVTFLGFIDKLLYMESGNDVYAAIMDYKSGKDYITLDNVTDGFHLQLPSYMYLLKNYPPFAGKKIHILGIYLQKVNKIALTNDKDMLTQIYQGFRLQGYSIKDPALLSILDPGYSKSDYIASMMQLKSGDFGKYSKVITEDEEEFLIKTVDEKINEASEGILSAEFPIAPKKIRGEDKSCTFCAYKDICFKRNRDYVNLKEVKFQKEEE